YALVRIANPGVADAKAGDVTHTPVYAEHLAVIAVDPGEGGRDAERVEAAHLHAGFAQSAPEARTRLVEAAHPVVKHAYTYALARLAAESFRKLIARAVIVD